MHSDGRVVARTRCNDAYVWIVYGLLMIHAFCYQLQTPLEPYLVDHLIGKGAEATATYGYLQSFYWMVQLVGSVAFGGFLDRYGCRVGLIVSNLAAMTQFLTLANTSSTTMLFLSKLPGMFAHPVLSSQTMVSKLTPEGPERITAFGRMVTAYTIGGVIGPYTGGLLGAKGNYYLSAKIATVGSFLVAMICYCLPADMDKEGAARAEAPLVDESGGAAEASGEKPELMPWGERVATICRLCGPLILLKVIMQTLSGVTKSADTVVMKNELHLTEADLGFIMSMQFAFMAVNSAVLLSPTTKVLGGRARLVVTKCLPIVSATYVMQAWLRSDHHGLLDDLSGLSQTYIFISATMMGTIFRFAMSCSITAENTRIVPKSIKGTLLGLEHSVASASRIASPTVGITLLTHLGSSGLYTFCAITPLVLLPAWLLFSARWLPEENEAKGPPGNSVEADNNVATSVVEMQKSERS
eukprot:TRINITY_DN31650_c0_g1_i1.p1 TRINITY_DN31650_c0_g1~~TRINITY_DN31650_c0_g1_i1.p1  ORF type:complete len:469 (+),score=60.33 TRINITY_DN31650_c0_g1_i1:58-1464(+)